jgi:Aspartyl protease
MFKQIFAAFVAILALNAAAAAQTTEAQTAAAKAICVLPAVADSVELKDVPGSDLVTVPVEINGKPKQFLLDIGSNASKVSRATVDELHLTSSTKNTETFQTGPATQANVSANTNHLVGTSLQINVVDVNMTTDSENRRPRVDISSFTIGGATGRNLQFVVANDGEIGKSAPYDGLMTGSFFKQYDVELDFNGRKMNYLTPNSCTDPNQVVFWPHSAVAMIPVTMSDGKIEVQVSIQGHVINAVIDTSSAHTVMRRDIAELKLGLKVNAPDTMPAGDLEDGMGMRVYRHVFSEISLAGGVAAYNVPVLIQAYSMVYQLDKQPVLGSRAQFKAEPRIPDLTLGMDVLHQLHLYVVHGQEAMYVTSAK